ncbi:hypothetical protein [Mesorhizobium caraganae]|uniref:hypothetical protein n=1 Tax=Mesorhizobium caraganae TaxID=483206 RepID=UPI003336B705
MHRSKISHLYRAAQISPEVGGAQKVATQVSRRKWYDLRSRQFRAILPRARQNRDPITPTMKTPMSVIVVNQLLILCCTATKNDVEFTLGKLGF